MVTLKSRLVMVITDIINRNGWSQKETASILGCTQPRVSNLVNARLGKFSCDTLIEIACKLGYRMDVYYDPTKDSPINITMKKSSV